MAKKKTKAKPTKKKKPDTRTRALIKYGRAKARGEKPASPSSAKPAKPTKPKPKRTPIDECANQLADVGYCAARFVATERPDNVCTLSRGHEGAHANTSTGILESAASELDSDDSTSASVPDSLPVGEPVFVTWPGTADGTNRRRGLLAGYTREGRPMVNLARVNSRGEYTGELATGRGRTFERHEVFAVSTECNSQLGAWEAIRDGESAAACDARMARGPNGAESASTAALAGQGTIDEDAPPAVHIEVDEGVETVRGFESAIAPVPDDDTPPWANVKDANPPAVTIDLVGAPMTGLCVGCGVDLEQLAKTGVTGHTVGGVLDTDCPKRALHSPPAVPKRRTKNATGFLPHTRCGRVPEVLAQKNPKLVQVWCPECNGIPCQRDTRELAMAAWNTLNASAASIVGSTTQGTLVQRAAPDASPDVPLLNEMANAKPVDIVNDPKLVKERYDTTMKAFDVAIDKARAKDAARTVAKAAIVESTTASCPKCGSAMLTTRSGTQRVCARCDHFEKVDRVDSVSVAADSPSPRIIETKHAASAGPQIGEDFIPPLEDDLPPDEGKMPWE